ncbi:MAG: hypothetical protein LKM43_01275 [Wolbachia endosymbiont of Penenirmus auritus]|nr:hypothetical protein [Wolbachia endosymbiont of Penenirmus auritus]
MTRNGAAWMTKKGGTGMIPLLTGKTVPVRFLCSRNWYKQMVLCWS